MPAACQLDMSVQWHPEVQDTEQRTCYWLVLCKHVIRTKASLEPGWQRGCIQAPQSLEQSHILKRLSDGRFNVSG